MYSVPDVNHVSGTDLEVFGLPSTIGYADTSCSNVRPTP